MGIKQSFKRAFYAIAGWLPIVRDVARTADTAAPITWRGLFRQKILGTNRRAYWPMHFTSQAHDVSRIRVGIGSAPGFSAGCYLQAKNGIEVGDYTIIAANVGLISADHDPHCHGQHKPAPPIRIGDYSWIGMNAVILPGVELGEHTVVAAGAVVNRSFPDGYCIVGGVPAKVIKQLDREQVDRHRSEHEYVGFHALAGRSKEDVFKALGIEEAPFQESTTQAAPRESS